MKTPDDESGWYIGKQIFLVSPMGGHGFSKGSQLGAFLRSLIIKSQCIHGGLVLRSLIFVNSIQDQWSQDFKMNIKSNTHTNANKFAAKEG